MAGQERNGWPIIIDRLIMITGPFRTKTDTVYNRLACLLVINNAKRVHKAVSPCDAVQSSLKRRRRERRRRRRRRGRRRRRKNRNLPIGD